MNIKSKARKGGLGLAAMLVIATPFTAHHEGLKLKAYLDPIGVPTICYGETKDIELGMTATLKECDDLLNMRLAYFGWNVDVQVTPDMHPKTHAAFTSFAYNVGLGNFGKSTLLRKANSGEMVEACNELSRWVYAGGKKFNGLVKRRADERALCLEGVMEQDANTNHTRS